MSGISPYVRTTGLADWNRHPTVNDERIDVHMDHDAAKAVGTPGLLGTRARGRGRRHRGRGT